MNINIFKIQKEFQKGLAIEKASLDLEKLCVEFYTYGLNWNISRVEYFRSNLIVAINKLQKAREL